MSRNLFIYLFHSRQAGTEVFIVASDAGSPPSADTVAGHFGIDLLDEPGDEDDQLYFYGEIPLRGIPYVKDAP